jgi:hypothetical protein
MDEPSTMHLADIDEGAWKGKYLLLNTAIPDSVMGALGVSMEMVVLWRWNWPNALVNKYSGRKYVSDYGRQAISQARSIAGLVEEVTSTGNRAGLVHSIQYAEPETFPLCEKNSEDYSRLESYLRQCDENYLIASGYVTDFENWSENEEDSEADTARLEFVDALEIVYGLYSDEKGVLKHLIILTAGPVKASRDLITLEEVDHLLKDVTLDCRNAAWTDVSFSMVESCAKDDQLVALGGFMVPEYRPHSLMLNVSSESKTYSFPLSPDQASFSIIAKSENEWEPVLAWTGYDQSGAVINTVTSSVRLFESSEDTGLVKLWAANNERLSEKREAEIDKTYGVVSQLYSMKIYPSYLTYDDELMRYAEVSTYAPDKEMVSKRETSGAAKKSLCSNFVCSLTAYGLRIILPKNGDVRCIRMYSLAGELLLEIEEPERFKTAVGYILPGAWLSSRIAAHTMVVIQVKGVKGVWNRRMVMRLQ